MADGSSITNRARPLGKVTRFMNSRKIDLMAKSGGDVTSSNAQTMLGNFGVAALTALKRSGFDTILFERDSVFFCRATTRLASSVAQERFVLKDLVKVLDKVANARLNETLDSEASYELQQLCVSIMTALLDELNANVDIRSVGRFRDAALGCVEEVVPILSNVMKSSNAERAQAVMNFYCDHKRMERLLVSPSLEGSREELALAIENLIDHLENADDFDLDDVFAGDDDDGDFGDFPPNNTFVEGDDEEFTNNVLKPNLFENMMHAQEFLDGDDAEEKEDSLQFVKHQVSQVVEVDDEDLDKDGSGDDTESDGSGEGPQELTPPGQEWANDDGNREEEGDIDEDAESSGEPANSHYPSVQRGDLRNLSTAISTRARDGKRGSLAGLARSSSLIPVIYSEIRPERFYGERKTLPRGSCNPCKRRTWRYLGSRRVVGDGRGFIRSGGPGTGGATGVS